MKKLSLAFIFAFFSSASLYAQIPDWEWAHSAESNYGIRSNTIALDTNGNIYTTGFGGGGLPIKFDSITINTPYFFISKYSSSGNIQWAKGTVGGNNAQGIGIAIDLFNNIIVCGKSAPDNITFGGITLNATGNFLVKYRPNGSVIWAKNAAGVGNDSASVMHITKDKLGNIYIIGYFNCHNLYIGNTLLNNSQLGGSGSNDCFIAKYDSLGNPLWAASSGGGNFLILARDNTKFSFRQFKSEDNCQTWIDQGDTLFVTSFYQSPPWLSFINYEGVGIVACYFTDRGQKKAFVIFGLAKDLIDIGASSWNLTTIKDIYNYAPSDWDNGYQSFFLPQNQYKGIGVGFKEVNSANAYPIVQFTNISGMKNVLVALGL